MTKHGLRIHMGKVHDIHYQDSIAEGEACAPRTRDAPKLVPRGHPFCRKMPPENELRAHWDAEHPTWLMHDARYVMEITHPSCQKKRV
ncbi:MAG: hypothetical protein ACUVT7_05585 [Thermoplasmata archaeon]